MTVQQLQSFVRSAIKLKQPDKDVAAYLRKVTLSERLDATTMEDLQAEGAGPRTREAIEALRAASQSMPAAAKPAPPPPPPKPVPPPDEEEQRRVIREATDYALNYTKSLPNFLCTQVTRRFVDPSGMEFWGQADVFTARVAYVDHKEDYKLVLVNNRMVTGDVSMQALGGATSSGEFGSMMAELFSARTGADFRWERWATLRGRRQHVYAYRVLQSRSQWHVIYDRTQDVVPGYHGEVFVDRDNLTISRIVLIAELPPDFPIQQAQTTLDYDLAEISGRQFVLPLRAVVRLREAKLLLKNEVEFRLYRKFAAEASITFDTPDALPDEKIKEEPPK